MDNRFRPVNPMLGSQPHFGPIPAEQLIPWTVISFTLYAISQNVLRLDWTWTMLLIFWGDATWWIVTGSKPYRFLSKFIITPNWTRGRLQYHSLLAYKEQLNHPQQKPKPQSFKTRRQKIRHP